MHAPWDIHDQLYIIYIEDWLYDFRNKENYSRQGGRDDGSHNFITQPIQRWTYIISTIPVGAMCQM